MHLIILKSNRTACKQKNWSRHSSLKLMYIKCITFSVKQSEVNKSHSQEKQKLSGLGLESFWGVVEDDPKAFLMKHVLKPSLSKEAFFAHYFPSFLIPSGMLQLLPCRELTGFPGLQAGRPFSKHHGSQGGREFCLYVLESPNVWCHEGTLCSFPFT